MRKKLDELYGERIHCKATYIVPHKNAARNIHGRSLLLNVKKCKTNEELAEHIWVETFGWTSHLTPGDVITFSGKVSSYIKYNNKVPLKREIDFTFTEPQNIQVIYNKYQEGKDKK